MNVMRTLAVALLAMFALPEAGFAQRLTLIAGGDIEWDLELAKPEVYYQPTSEWRPIPFLLTEERREHLRRTNPELLAQLDFHIYDSIHYDLSFDNPVDQARHPFLRLQDVFRSGDVVFANLETAVSDHARRPYDKALRTPAAFADAIAWAGITVVSLANNHAFDAEGQGLLDSIENMRRAGVGYAGAGRNIEEARQPFLVERNGVRLAFLSYTHFVNQFNVHAFATPNRSGVSPMDPLLIAEDIARVREQVDYVILSFHWDQGGALNSSTIVDPHPRAQEFARAMIDAGADIILGHHPPLPRGVEVYNNGLIFYSLGKLIFGHNHREWTDNILARLVLEPGGVASVEFVPVAGEGVDMAQPYPLSGERARRVLQAVQERSARLGTQLDIVGDVGVVRGLPRVGAPRARAADLAPVLRIAQRTVAPAPPAAAEAEATPAAPAAQPAGSAIDAAGTYAFTVYAGSQSAHGTARIDRDAEGAYGGVVSIAALGDLPVRSVVVEGSRITVTAGSTGDTMILVFDLSGDTFSGEWRYSGRSGALDGTRS